MVSYTIYNSYDRSVLDPEDEIGDDGRGIGEPPPSQNHAIPYHRDLLRLPDSAAFATCAVLLLCDISARKRAFMAVVAAGLAVQARKLGTLGRCSDAAAIGKEMATIPVQRAHAAPSPESWSPGWIAGQFVEPGFKSTKERGRPVPLSILNLPRSHCIDHHQRSHLPATNSPTEIAMVQLCWKDNSPDVVDAGVTSQVEEQPEGAIAHDDVHNKDVHVTCKGPKLSLEGQTHDQVIVERDPCMLPFPAPGSTWVAVGTRTCMRRWNDPIASLQAVGTYLFVSLVGTRSTMKSFYDGWLSAMFRYRTH
ncbi:hypothetical protein IEO21_07512 [Rhodonia placenta]|uniref:Uncharacterized protein n=1 Tax=Rhodonia placenta TaxID=104341 RepID=A0A8H7NY06_9APHY|nr:hypothetical protein IEO21_07512 [Postia placenta]